MLILLVQAQVNRILSVRGVPELDHFQVRHRENQGLDELLDLLVTAADDVMLPHGPLIDFHSRVAGV